MILSIQEPGARSVSSLRRLPTAYRDYVLTLEFMICAIPRQSRQTHPKQSPALTPCLPLFGLRKQDGS
jgi:hypothetical protein